MGFVIAAVALVGALCVLDLLLTVAVLRRLREHETVLERLRPEADVDALVGARVPDFTLTTVEGRTLTAAGLRGRRWLLALLSVGCGPCREQAPALRDAGDDVVAIVTGEGAPANGLVEDLRGAVAVVTVQAGSGPGAALGVSVYPTLLAVDEDGVVSAAAHNVAGLGRPSAGRV